jgi:hypothetical protein
MKIVNLKGKLSLIARKFDDYKFPYAAYIINLLMIDQPVEVITTEYYSEDIANLILRTRQVFEEGVKLYKQSAQNKGIKVPDSSPDLVHGGE